MVEIFAEIAEERHQQDTKWGGAAHDDQHDEDDWIEFIEKHARRAAPGLGFDRQLFRRQMVRVAALAVAAIEWVDRR